MSSWIKVWAVSTTMVSLFGLAACGGGASSKESPGTADGGVKGGNGNDGGSEAGSGTGGNGHDGGTLADGGTATGAALKPLDGTAVSMGRFMACALTTDHLIVCWGGTANPQRDAMYKNASLVTASGTPTQLSVGNAIACARFEDGSVSCWGGTDASALGGAAADDPATIYDAVLVAGGVKFDSVSAGDRHACGVSAGAVYCWGANDDGQLGTGNTADASLATQVPGITNATAVSAGTSHTCALLSTGQVSCWGANDYGQIGIAPGAMGAPVLAPTLVPGVAGATGMGAGGTESCAVVGGKVSCWGAVWYAQSPDPTTEPAPVTIAGVSGVTSLALDRGDGSGSEGPLGCAASAANVWCWALAAQTSGVLVPGNGVPSQIATASGASCGVFAGQAIECWGDNSGYLLGDGSFATLPTPTEIAGLPPAVSLFAGGDATCALGKDGHTRCWGNDDYNPTDDGSIVAVPALDGATVMTFGESDGECAAVAGGSVVCTSPFAAPAAQVLAPLTVAGITSPTSLVLAEDGTGCGVLGDGSLSCWPTGPGAATVAAGVSGVKSAALVTFDVFPELCILQADGAHCQQTSLPPTQVAGIQPGLAGVTTLAGQGDYACGETPAGVSCASFEVGVPTLPSGPVAGTSGATILAVGSDHACAVIKGAVVCWGQGSAGQLGPGDFETVQAAFPLDLPTPTALAAGSSHTCALEADGSVWCWGDNSSAQIAPHLGTQPSPTPVQLAW